MAVPAPAPSAPPAPPAPPATLPAAQLLPAAPMPVLPAPSERVQTEELARLFWGGIHGALAPAAMDEQWRAVRSLVVAAS